MIEVFLCFDSKLKDKYIHVINSIKRNTKEKCHFNFIVDFEMKCNEAEIIHVESPIKKYYQYGLVKSRGMFLRWLIPKYCDSDRALYFDNDVIVIGDVKELMSIEMNDDIICAVPNYYQKTVKETFFHQGNSPIGGDSAAFLSGQLVIDCKKWRYEKITEKLIAFTERYGILDEAAINIILANRITALDRHWCVPANRIDEIKSDNNLLYEYDFKKTKLLHWAGKDKPWNTNCRNREFYYSYLT